MKKTRIACLIGILFCICCNSALSQESVSKVRISLLVGESGEPVFHQLLVQEITKLLENRYDIDFQTISVDYTKKEEAKNVLEQLYADDEVKCIIGLGLDTSQLLVELGVYKKPVIAAIILDRLLQGLPKTEDGTSGITNFNYIESPFNVERDLKTFKKLYNFNNLAVLLNAREALMYHTLYSYMGRAVERVSPDAKLTIVDIYPGKLKESFEVISPEVDAVYLPPVFLQDEIEQQRKLIEMINGRNLPSFALLGEESVQMGAMASIAPDRNINAMSRRIAINLLNILSGDDAGEQPVSVTRYVENYVINVETLEQIDFQPSWRAMSEARLINFDRGAHGREISLRDAIKEALQNNLDYQIEQINTTIQIHEKEKARSGLLPQAVLSSSINTIDENRVESGLGYTARHTWSGTGSVSQMVYVDDVVANYQIQKILLESQKYQERIQLLDTVITASEAYINMLFARTNRTIQNNNLNVTRKNLEIAKSKEAVGSVGATEVHRWESELASNQINLNDAYRDLQLARMSLNQILNRPLKEEYVAEEVGNGKEIELLITEPKVYQYLGDMKQLKEFGKFLVDEADKNLPEIKQIEENVQVQERSVLNRKRAFYFPDVQLQAQIDKILREYDYIAETPSELDHPWGVTLTASWPLYTGGDRRAELQRSRAELRQISLQEKNLRNQLHLRIRSNLETAAVSAREIRLSRLGLQSARKNFEIIQAGYSEGRNTIADLIDAQNAQISAERGEAVAKYQFVLDFLLLERSVGNFAFLATPNEKEDFLFRLETHMTQ